MGTPMRKTQPNWLSQQDPDDPNLNPNYRRSVIYYRQLYQAWPEYLRNDPRYGAIYRECKRLRKLGRRVQVDHIVPIKSPIVSGLHVPWNLRIISEQENAVKSNHMWPGHPCENREFFELELTPYQMSLPL